MFNVAKKFFCQVVVVGASGCVMFGTHPMNLKQLVVGQVAKTGSVVSTMLVELYSVSLRTIFCSHMPHPVPVLRVVMMNLWLDNTLFLWLSARASFECVKLPIQNVHILVGYTCHNNIS
jgi:hypothetical protein